MIPDFLYQEPTIRALVDLIRNRYEFYTNETEAQFNNLGFLRDSNDIDYWKAVYGIIAETNASMENTKAIVRTKNVVRQQLTEDVLKQIARLYTDNEIEVYHQGSLNPMIDYIIVNDRKVILVGGGVDTTQLSDRFVNVFFKHSNPTYLWWWNIKEDGSSNLEKVSNMGQPTKKVVLRESNVPYEITVVENGDEGTLHAETLPYKDVPNWTVIIKFVGKYGVPDNVNNFKKIMREIIPAHLDIQYEYLYNSWSQVDAKNLKWSDVDTKNLTWKQVDEGGLIT